MNTASTTIRIGELQAPDYAALEAARTQSALLDWGELPTFVVTGPDRSTWLNGLLTCDVSGVRPGQGAWGLLLDRLGKIRAVLGVLADGQQFYVGVLWGDPEAVLKELDARLVMEDAELAPSDARAFWRLRVGQSLPASEVEAHASGLVTLGSKGLLSVALGAALDTRDAPTLSMEAWTTFRIKHGLPWGGVDFDDAERPHEAALERRAVSWSKGCYLGQEVVCMQDMRGKVKRSVRAFTVRSATGPSGAGSSCDVFQGPKAVGRVTSAVYDPRAERYWLLAQIPLATLPDAAAEAEQDAATDLTWPGASGPSGNEADGVLRVLGPKLAWAE